MDSRKQPVTVVVTLKFRDQEIDRTVETLRAQGIQARTTIRRGDPVQQILADSQDEDLIVLGTHGKAGIDAFWAGSVAPKVVSQTRLPVLLVPASGR